VARDDPKAKTVSSSHGSDGASPYRPDRTPSRKAVYWYKPYQEAAQNPNPELRTPPPLTGLARECSSLLPPGI
jgi:hypothetical protein